MSDFNENSDQPKFPLNTNNTQNNNLQSLDDLIIYNADLMNTNIDISNPNNESNENTSTQNCHSKMSEAEPLKKNHETSSAVIQIPVIEDNDSPIFSNQNTLDESILTTIYRDLLLIYTKLKFVVIPYGSKDKKNIHIKQWDLWGPLLLNMALAITLAMNSQEKSHMIISIFVIFWLGGVILFLNANFLGVKSSIFQILCLLGYCLFPLNLSAIFVTLFNINDILRLFFVAITCLWSIYSSSDFLRSITNQDQRYLVLYPCILFYLYISWFIISAKK